MKSAYSLWLLALSLILLGNENLAQQSSRLTPEQCQTLRSFSKQYLGNTFVIGYNGQIGDERRDEFLATLDPILVGKNVIFGKSWLEYIGKDKPFTEEQWIRFRDQSDMVYECGVDLFGADPESGEIIFVNIESNEQFRGSVKNAGGQAPYGHYVRINARHFVKEIENITRGGLYNLILVHEMGHVFSNKRQWDIEGEAVAALFVCYVEEHIPEITGLKPALRDSRRKGLFTRAHRKFLAGTLELRAKDEHEAEAWDYYLWGLVDKVGWDTYKKVFRSYHDDSYQPSVNYFTKPFSYYSYIQTERGLKAISKTVFSIANIRDFFTRVEDFSGKRSVWRTLPDKGKIFDQHFAATAVPLDEAGNETVSSSVVAVSLPKPVQKPA